MADQSPELSGDMPEKYVWTTSIPNRTPKLVIVSVVFLVITTLFFVTRTTVRSRIRQWGWDDLMAFIAYMILVVQTSFLFTAAHHGFGKHRANISMLFSTAMFWFWLYQIFYKILGAFTKLTFCVLYLRLFPQELFRRIDIAVASIIAAGSFSFMIATIFQCSPVARNWNKSLTGSCIDFNAFWYSHATFNTVLDIVVFIMPIPLIRKLNMDRRSRWGLASIFLLGAFTIVASIIRMTELYGSAVSQTDPTWGSTTALIWTEIEANTAVICCCLPALRQAAMDVWRKMLSKTGPETPATPHAENGRVRSGPSALEAGNFASSGANQKMWGTVADIRYSPPVSLDKPAQAPWSPLHVNQPAPVAAGSSRWNRNWKLPTFRIGKDVGTREEDLTPNDATSRIKLGTFNRRQDFDVRSETMAVDDQPPAWRLKDRDFNPFDYTLDEFLKISRERGG